MNPSAMRIVQAAFMEATAVAAEIGIDTVVILRSGRKKQSYGPILVIHCRQRSIEAHGKPE
jgi:hypothetical protein